MNYITNALSELILEIKAENVCIELYIMDTKTDTKTAALLKLCMYKYRSYVQS